MRMEPIGMPVQPERASILALFVNINNISGKKGSSSSVASSGSKSSSKLASRSRTVQHTVRSVKYGIVGEYAEEHEGDSEERALRLAQPVRAEAASGRECCK